MAQGQELIQNGGMESLDHWSCGGFACTVITDDKREGSAAIKVTDRQVKNLCEDRIRPIL